MLEKCASCRNKSLRMPKLQLDSQNETHYLRWGSNPVEIKILKKSGKMQQKKKCRLVRFVCLKCIQQNKVNNFTKAKRFAIFKSEQERQLRPCGPRDYLRREEVIVSDQCSRKGADEAFLAKLEFHDCVREEKLRIVNRRKQMNGKKSMSKSQHVSKEVPKKKKSSVSDKQKDNEKILSKILNEFKISEKGVHEIPGRLDLSPILPDANPQKDLAILLPGKADLEEPFRAPVRPPFGFEHATTGLALGEPEFRKKIKLTLGGSLSEKQRLVKRGMESQLKKWKKLFTKKQEIENKLNNHKKNSIQANMRPGETGASGRESVGQAVAKKPPASRKRQTSRSKILKLGNKKAKTGEPKVADPKRELYESQLREERRISNLIYNKSNKRLDLESIRERHERILKKVSVKPEESDSRAPLCGENGHFNWDFMENEFFDQSSFNRREFARLDRSLVKKLHCEFLFMNENQLRPEPLKNFLGEFLLKHSSSRSDQPPPTEPGSSGGARSQQVTGNAACQSRARLARNLQKFEEMYLSKFKQLITDKVHDSRRLLHQWIIFPQDSIKTLNANFPSSERSRGNLPLNYFEDIVAPSEKGFKKLLGNVQAHRAKVVAQMSRRVREHFRWIDRRVLDNRVIWTALRSYLRNHDVLRGCEFGLCDFKRFLNELFAEEGSPETRAVLADERLWESSCRRLCETVGYERGLAFLREEQTLGLRQRKDFITYTDYFKKIKFLFTFEHYKINKGLLKDSSKLDETDCVLCFTAITCLSNPIIYCSKCERGAHRICLRLPSVPSEDFFCIRCSEELRKKTRKKESPARPRPARKEWMDQEQGHTLRSARTPFQLRVKQGELLMVDRKLLLMKNRNSASKAEDINRLLSSKLDIRFDGKLCGESEKWVHLEVPFRVVLSMVYALIKANFQIRKEHEAGLELDLTKNQLRVKHISRVKNNHVILDLDRNYNLEDWVYSSRYCSVAKSPSGPELETLRDMHSAKRAPLWDSSTETGLSGESVHGQGGSIEDVIVDGMSNRVQARPTASSFRVFTCENMMILKKLIENDENFPKCMKGDEEWVRKLGREVGHEIGRVVHLFRESWFNPGPTQGMSFLFPPKKPKLGSKEEPAKEGLAKSTGADALDTTHKHSMPLEISKGLRFEKPHTTKAGKPKHVSPKKASRLEPKELKIQEISMVRPICFEGRVTDDIRLYGSLSLSDRDSAAHLEVDLVRKFKCEISAFVYMQESKDAMSVKRTSGVADSIDINPEVFRPDVPSKGRSKKKGPGARNGIKSEAATRERLSKDDCCYFCGRSEFMLIEFEDKRVHLICLIVSGHLLDFFGRPECRVSTLVIFLKLVKYAMLSLLLRQDRPAFLARLRHARDSAVPPQTQVLLEVRQLFLQSLHLRREIIEIGAAVFKKNICGVQCALCTRSSGESRLTPDAAKKGCLFRFLTGFSETLRRRIERELGARPEERPFYVSTLQQSVSALKHLVELDSPFAEAFPEVARFQREFLKKEFSLLRCRNCPNKYFHGICAYFNGNRLDLRTSRSDSKFRNFLKKDGSDYVIEGLCAECSRNSYQAEESPRTMDQVEFLRRLPVNIDFIKKKMDFESFLEWKKQHTHHFTLE